MTDTGNQLSVQQVTIDPGLVQRPRTVVGVDLSRIQYLTQLSGDAAAPHFLPDQEPTQDDRAYPAQDGKLYYRPQLRIAARSLPIPGPEVRFLKDADGNVSFHFDLEEAPRPDLPQGAAPFNVRVERVTLRWQPNGEMVFEQPLMMPHDAPQDRTKPNFTIRVGAPVPADRVDALYAALSQPQAAAALQVDLAFGYWLDVPAPGPTTGGGPVTLPPIVFQPPARTTGAIVRDHRTHRPPGGGRPATQLESSPEAAAGVASFMAGLDAQFVTAPPPAAAQRVWAIDAIVRDHLVFDQIVDQAEDRQRQPNFKSVSIPRTLPFTFQPDLEANKPIYNAIKGSEALTETWAASPHGLISKAPFPNTVYRLPDELRLAYNPDLGTPHLVPTLYRDPQDEPRVRVTLRAVPWHKPDELVALRQWLHQASAGAYAAPNIVIGGYKEAKLRLITQFPESIKVLGGDEVAVSLEGGFDLTLDLSLEFYKYLCELLVGPLGLTGEIAITVDGPPPTPGAPPAPQIWRRPLRLNLDDIASLPVEVRLATAEVSPHAVQIANQAHVPVRVGGCAPLLLQHDRNSVVPIGVFDATTSTPFPAELAADGVLTVQIAPQPEFKDQLWNAVQVELLGQELMQSPQETLERIHELAPSGTLAWKITVECPPFLQDPVPAQFQNLFRVEAQILREGYAPQQVVLKRGQGTAQVTMQRSLRDLLREEAQGIQTFKYKVRNIYFDHEGGWGQEHPAEGSSIVVFPNPMAND